MKRGLQYLIPLLLSGLGAVMFSVRTVDAQVADFAWQPVGPDELAQVRVERQDVDARVEKDAHHGAFLQE